jgi:WD40 repeat protein
MYTLITEVLFLFVTNLIPFFMLINRHLVPSRLVKFFFHVCKKFYQFHTNNDCYSSAYYVPMFFIYLLSIQNFVLISSNVMQYLLSSSMDKTVKLWHISSLPCLKTFSHSDYGITYPFHCHLSYFASSTLMFLYCTCISVTCIQFNPVDDRYFISGSLDEKVRIWNIQNREIVDWNDLHEMVTAACYAPDGQV